MARSLHLHSLCAVDGPLLSRNSLCQDIRHSLPRFSARRVSLPPAWLAVAIPGQAARELHRALGWACTQVEAAGLRPQSPGVVACATRSSAHPQACVKQTGLPCRDGCPGLAWATRKEAPRRPLLTQKSDQCPRGSTFLGRPYVLDKQGSRLHPGLP